MKQKFMGVYSTENKAEKIREEIGKWNEEELDDFCGEIFIESFIMDGTWN